MNRMTISILLVVSILTFNSAFLCADSKFLDSSKTSEKEMDYKFIAPKTTIATGIIITKDGQNIFTRKISEDNNIIYYYLGHIAHGIAVDKVLSIANTSGPDEPNTPIATTNNVSRSPQNGNHGIASGLIVDGFRCEGQSESGQLNRGDSNNEKEVVNFLGYSIRPWRCGDGKGGSWDFTKDDKDQMNGTLSSCILNSFGNAGIIVQPGSYQFRRSIAENKFLIYSDLRTWYNLSYEDKVTICVAASRIGERVYFIIEVFDKNTNKLLGRWKRYGGGRLGHYQDY